MNAVARPALAALLGGVLFAAAGCTRIADNQPAFAYVTNGASDSVSVIDLGALRVTRTIAVGHNPTGVAANPLRNEIYVVNTDSNNVSFIDAEKNAVVATVGVHRAPYFISVSADGGRGYVANSGSANVSVLDLQQRKVIATVPVGGAPGLARVSPDGKTVVVSNRADNTVSRAPIEIPAGFTAATGLAPEAATSRATAYGSAFTGDFFFLFFLVVALIHGLFVQARISVIVHLILTSPIECLIVEAHFSS